MNYFAGEAHSFQIWDTQNQTGGLCFANCLWNLYWSSLTAPKDFFDKEGHGFQAKKLFLSTLKSYTLQSEKYLSRQTWSYMVYGPNILPGL